MTHFLSIGNAKRKRTGIEKKTAFLLANSRIRPGWMETNSQAYDSYAKTDNFGPRAPTLSPATAHPNSQQLAAEFHAYSGARQGRSLVKSLCYGFAS
jgi:hypothetical protein